MEIVYVGLDLGSSSFQQVAIKTDGSVKVNRSSPPVKQTCERPLRISVVRFTCIWKRESWRPGRRQ